MRVRAIICQECNKIVEGNHQKRCFCSKKCCGAYTSKMRIKRFNKIGLKTYKYLFSCSLQPGIKYQVKVLDTETISEGIFFG